MASIIRNVASNLVLEVYGGVSIAGIPLWANNKNGSPGQKWFRTMEGLIRSAMGDFYIDLKDIDDPSKKELQMNFCNFYSPTQQWQDNTNGTITNKSNGWALTLGEQNKVFIAPYDPDNIQSSQLWKIEQA